MTENTLLGPSWTLAFGPGPQAELLEPLLRTLLAQSASEGSPRLEVWDDLDEVLGALSQRGRLVLDADRLPREDLGLVRRFLTRRSGWEVVALGGEAPTGPLAQLLSHRRVQFAAWPLPVDRLSALFETPSELSDRPHASQFRDTRSRRARASLVPSPAEASGPLPRRDPGESSPGGREGDLDPDLGMDLGLEDPLEDAWEQSKGGSWEVEPEDWHAGDPPEGSTGDLQEIETILSTGAQGSLHPADLIPRGGAPVATAPEAKLPPKQDSLLAEAMAIGLSREELDAFHAFDPDEAQDLAELAESQSGAGTQEGTQEDAILEDHLGSTASAAPSSAAIPGSRAPAESELVESPLAASPPVAVPPSWYRSQVADLADLAQRLQLDSLALREAGGAASGAGDAWLALEQDVLRLGQFARTLGFVAAPPAPGSQSVELSGFVQELMASLLGNQPGEGPRVLFRGAADATVRADKAQLGAALDAMAQLGAHCIQADGSDEAMRVQISTGQEGRIHLEMDFPAGPLAGQEGSRSDLLEPYALRRVFPDYGANALAAAGGIFLGHGGTLEARGLAGGRLALFASLPQAPPATGSGSPITGR